jgi:hypothetical protein
MSRSLAAWYHKQINANMLQADKQQWQCIQQLDYLLTAANQQYI